MTDTSTDISAATPSTSQAAKLLRLGLILIIGVGLDQLTKWWLARMLAPHDIVVVIPGFFNLVHVYNKGAAFGLLASWSPTGVRLFFIVTKLAIVAVLGYLYWRTPRNEGLFLWGYSLVLSGALGNLIDRIRLGQVFDFLDFYLGRHHWPAFNVADSLICIGAGLLILGLWRTEGGADVSRAD